MTVPQSDLHMAEVLAFEAAVAHQLLEDGLRLSRSWLPWIRRMGDRMVFAAERKAWGIERRADQLEMRLKTVSFKEMAERYRSPVCESILRRHHRAAAIADLATVRVGMYQIPVSLPDGWSVRGFHDEVTQSTVFLVQKGPIAGKFCISDMDAAGADGSWVAAAFRERCEAAIEAMLEEDEGNRFELAMRMAGLSDSTVAQNARRIKSR